MSTNGATSVNSKANSNPKFAAQLKQLISIARDISERGKDLENLGQLIDGKGSMQQTIETLSRQLKEKEAEISQLKTTHHAAIAKCTSEKNILQFEFGEKYKKWSENNDNYKRLEVRAQELKEQLTRARDECNNHIKKLDSAEEQNQQYRKAAQATSTKLKDLRADLSSTEIQLEGAKAQVEQLKAKLREGKSKLKLESLDIANLNAGFSKLVKTCHSLAKQFFLVPLPQDKTFDLLWPNLQQSGFTKETYAKFPISSSPASQHLRMAVAERVIARHLCTEIFQQYYLPRSGSGSGINLLDDVLGRLYEHNREGEAIFRGQLLAAYTEEEEKDQVRKLIDDTKIKISHILRPLLFTNDMQDSFQLKLHSLLVEAVNLWKPIQRSVVRGQVDNEPGDEWTDYIEHDQAFEEARDGQAYTNAGSDAIMSLFPQISVGEEIVCQGHALWSNQNSVITAAAEYAQLTSPPSLIRRRTNSIAHRGAASVEGGARRPLSGATRSSGDSSSTASFSTHVQRREQQ